MAVNPPDAGTEAGTDGGAPSFSGLLKRLGNETGDLVRAEVALAKLEFRELARQAAMDGAKVGAAAALAMVGVSALAAAAVLALGHALDGRYGLAALAVGLILLAVGAGLAWSGVRSMARTAGPAATIDSLRQDGEWAAQTLSDFRRELKRGKEASERPALSNPETGSQK